MFLYCDRPCAVHCYKIAHRPLLVVHGKEVQIVHRLFLVNCYLVRENIRVEQKQIETKVSIYYL